MRDGPGLLIQCLGYGFMCSLMMRVWLITQLILEAQLDDRLALSYSRCPLSLLETNLHLPVGGRYSWCPLMAVLTSPPWHGTFWTWLLHEWEETITLSEWTYQICLGSSRVSAVPRECRDTLTWGFGEMLNKRKFFLIHRFYCKVKWSRLIQPLYSSRNLGSLVAQRAYIDQLLGK